MPDLFDQLQETGFESDGCTWFFQTWRGIDLVPCCTAHDLDWFLNISRDFGQWLLSNFQLGSCFVNIGAWELALPAIIATSTIGFGMFYLWRKKKKNGDKN